MSKGGAQVGQFAPPSQRIDLHVYVHVESSNVEGKLDRLLAGVNAVLKLEAVMANELEDLTAAVARETEVDKSAIVLIEGISARLDAAIASGDPKKLVELSSSLKTSSDDLAAAVLAHTPAE